MSIHSQLFPEHLSYGTRGGGGFSTAIKMSDSGVERRSSDWQPHIHRMQYDVAKAVQDEDDIAAILDFYMCMRGAACGFRFKDPADFSTATDGTSEPSTIADAWTAGDWEPGTTLKTFYIRKQYTSSIGDNATAFWRNITRPIPPGYPDHKLTVYVGGDLVYQAGGDASDLTKPWKVSVDYDTGRIIFDEVPNGEVKVACTFHVPARFGQEADDGLDIVWDAPGQFSIATLPIVEIAADPPTGEEEWLEGAHEVNTTPAGNWPVSQPFPLRNYFEEFVPYNSGSAPLGWYVEYALAQLNPSTTGGPQTPMASGEYFMGGPICLLSTTAATPQPVRVHAPTPTGANVVVDTLNGAGYIEVYWLGNSVGYKSR